MLHTTLQMNANIIPVITQFINGFITEEALIQLICLGADLTEHKNKQGDNALQLLLQHPEISERLLFVALASIAKSKNIFNSANNIHYRSKEKCFELTQQLVASGFELTKKNRHGDNVLHSLLKQNQLETKKNLIIAIINFFDKNALNFIAKIKAITDLMPETDASTHQLIDAVNHVIDSHKNKINDLDSHKHSALLLAMQKENENIRDIIFALLDQGADPHDYLYSIDKKSYSCGLLFLAANSKCGLLPNDIPALLKNDKLVPEQIEQQICVLKNIFFLTLSDSPNKQAIYRAFFECALAFFENGLPIDTLFMVNSHTALTVLSICKNQALIREFTPKFLALGANPNLCISRDGPNGYESLNPLDYFIVELIDKYKDPSQPLFIEIFDAQVFSLLLVHQSNILTNIKNAIFNFFIEMISHDFGRVFASNDKNNITIQAMHFHETIKTVIIAIDILLSFDMRPEYVIIDYVENMLKTAHHTLINQFPKIKYQLLCLFLTCEKFFPLNMNTAKGFRLLFDTYPSIPIKEIIKNKGFKKNIALINLLRLELKYAERQRIINLEHQALIMWLLIIFNSFTEANNFKHENYLEKLPRSILSLVIFYLAESFGIHTSLKNMYVLVSILDHFCNDIKKWAASHQSIRIIQKPENISLALKQRKRIEYQTHTYITLERTLLKTQVHKNPRLDKLCQKTYTNSSQAILDKFKKEAKPIETLDEDLKTYKPYDLQKFSLLNSLPTHLVDKKSINARLQQAAEAMVEQNRLDYQIDYQSKKLRG